MRCQSLFCAAAAPTEKLAVPAFIGKPESGSLKFAVLYTGVASKRLAFEVQPIRLHADRHWQSGGNTGRKCMALSKEQCAGTL
jgi:hypothetical protein